MLVVAALAFVGGSVLSAQPEHGAVQPAAAAQPEPAAAQHAPGAAPSGEHAPEAEHGSPVVGMIAKLFNFALLAGTLVYFLRAPLATYLSDRGKQIRSDLVKAAGMKQSATEQLAKIDAKMAALPGELGALRKTGAQEVAAEEARMRQAAEGERTRLIEQSARDIEWQLKIAERDLRQHAGALAVDLATKRVKATITAADQARLVDRYVAQVGN
jgi:F0F1-type ATP synthase membrane subunit b/b'